MNNTILVKHPHAAMKAHLLYVFCIIIPSILISQESAVIDYVSTFNKLTDTTQFHKVDSLIAIYRFSDKGTSKYLIEKAFKIAEGIADQNYLARANNLKGISHHVAREIDSSRIYMNKALELYKSNNNKKGEADILSNIGRVLGSQGLHKQAVQNYIQALEIYDEIGNKIEAAGTKFNLSIPWLELGNYERAEKILYEVLEYYESTESEDQIYKVKWHLGAAYAKREEYDKSIILDRELLAYYKRVDDKYHTMVAHNIVGIDLYHLEKYDSTVYHCERSLFLGKNMDDAYTVAINHQYIGAAQSKLGNHRLAIEKIEKSLALFESIGYSDEIYNAYSFLYKAQEKAGLYQSALNSLKTYSSMKDSIASVEMQTGMAELETKYETEKKEAQIVLLNKEAELDATKKRGLWISLGLFGLSSIFALFGITQRNKKKQAIEFEKRKSLERELEFKKKELLTKVMQLAKKNEFLNTLENEVNQLKVSVGNSITPAAGRIDRMIQNDSIDAEEWDQFSTEFSSVHEGFIQKITKAYGTFSQSELRLISLLKMNLTSKDIANILRISDEGIKKARYRLRKKMKLESGQDLQGIILGL